MPGVVGWSGATAAGCRPASREKRGTRARSPALAQEIVRGLPVIQALGGERQARDASVSSTRAACAPAGRQRRSRRRWSGRCRIRARRRDGGRRRRLARCWCCAASLTLGALTLLSAYVTQLLRPIERLNDLAETAAEGRERRAPAALLDRSRRCATPASRSISRGRAASSSCATSGLPMRDRGARRSCDGVNLRLQPGELAVLVGVSGAGKSTLLSLLVRLFDPTEGTILLDGIPLHTASRIALAPPADRHDGAGHAAVRRHRFGRRSGPREGAAADERIWEALAQVAMDCFVRGIARRLDTALGEDGVNLSGGQRQRLSLARAFLLDRPILLLDEPLVERRRGVRSGDRRRARRPRGPDVPSPSRIDCRCSSTPTRLSADRADAWSRNRAGHRSPRWGRRAR